MDQDLRPGRGRSSCRADAMDNETARKIQRRARAPSPYRLAAAGPTIYLLRYGTMAATAGDRIFGAEGMKVPETITERASRESESEAKSFSLEGAPEDAEGRSRGPAETVQKKQKVRKLWKRDRTKFLAPNELVLELLEQDEDEAGHGPASERTENAVDVVLDAEDPAASFMEAPSLGTLFDALPEWMFLKDPDSVVYYTPERGDSATTMTAGELWTNVRTAVEDAAAGILASINQIENAVASKRAESTRQTTEDEKTAFLEADSGTDATGTTRGRDLMGPWTLMPRSLEDKEKRFGDRPEVKFFGEAQQILKEILGGEDTTVPHDKIIPYIREIVSKFYEQIANEHTTSKEKYRQELSAALLMRRAATGEAEAERVMGLKAGKKGLVDVVGHATPDTAVKEKEELLEAAEKGPPTSLHILQRMGLRAVNLMRGPGLLQVALNLK
ncbi:unnamed protein product [Amoebophrya sp. A120]|nr:unnamed protein product [Amoebophrya sp. A120]|eukprot:GSA120T00013234001.1